MRKSTNSAQSRRLNPQPEVSQVFADGSSLCPAERRTVGVAAIDARSHVGLRVDGSIQSSETNEIPHACLFLVGHLSAPRARTACRVASLRAADDGVRHRQLHCAVPSVAYCYFDRAGNAGMRRSLAFYPFEIS